MSRESMHAPRLETLNASDNAGSGFTSVSTHRSRFSCTSNTRDLDTAYLNVTQRRNKILVICHYHALHTQTTSFLFLYIAFLGLAIRAYCLGPINRDHGLKYHLGHAGISPISYILLSCGGFHMGRHQVQEVASYT